jgi:hypothetical protein
VALGIRCGIFLAISLLLTACALFSTRIDGTRVDFRLSAAGRNLQEIAFFIPARGRLTHIEVLRRAPEGGRRTVWSAHGVTPVDSLTARGFRDSIGYGVDTVGLTQDVAAAPLVDSEIYVVYVTVTDDAGRTLRGGTVFLASEKEGVDHGCDSIKECSAYALSTIT